MKTLYKGLTLDTLKDKTYLGTDANGVIIEGGDATDMQIFIDYDGGTNPIYVGFGDKGLATSATGWEVFKLTWDASDNMTVKKTAEGIYDNRDSLTYE